MSFKPKSPTVSRRLILAATAASLLPHTPVWSQKTDLLIGQTTPLSGPYAAFMVGLLKGQQMAFDEVNQRGGINGRNIKLITLDDGFDPKRTLENARTLIEKEQVIALFGVVGTAQTAAVLPYITEKQVPLISIYTGSPALRAKTNPYLFTTQASYTDELVKIVRNLKAIQSTRLAVVYQNNEFGKLMLPLAEKIIVAEGAEVVAARMLDGGGADAVAVAQGLTALRPNAVIMLVAGPAVVPFIKANRTYVGAPIYTLSISIVSSILTSLGEDARGLAIARVTPYPWRATTPLTREFNQIMKRLGTPVDYDHFTGYINARILIEGLRGAGKNPTPQSLTQSMEKLNQLDLGGYKLAFSPENHNGSTYVEITVMGPNGNFLR